MIFLSFFQGDYLIDIFFKKNDIDRRYEAILSTATISGDE